MALLAPPKITAPSAAKMPLSEREHKRRQLLAELEALEATSAPAWDEYQEDQTLPLIDRACTYLSRLRESGETNMYHSPGYLRRRYGLGRDEALSIFTFWAEHFEALKTQSAEEAWRQANVQALSEATSQDERVDIIKKLPSRPF